jgi:hypothetical protein
VRTAVAVAVGFDFFGHGTRGEALQHHRRIRFAAAPSPFVAGAAAVGGAGVAVRKALDRSVACKAKAPLSFGRAGPLWHAYNALINWSG